MVRATGADSADVGTPTLRVHVLGGFRVTRDGGEQPPEHWTRPSARTIVKLLAVAPDHQMHREEMLALLWPEADAGAATRNLGVALHAARRALQPELTARQPSAYLTSDGALLRLDPHTVWIDADQAEQQAIKALDTGDGEDLAAAVAAFTGELLPEDRFADWATARRDRIEQLHGRVRLDLAEAVLAAGRAEDAIAIAREVLIDHPTDERAHRTVMRGYLTLGLRRQAIHQYHACREALDTELGIRPGLQTEELHVQALGGSGGPVRSGDDQEALPPPALRGAAVPLRGRDAVIAELAADTGTIVTGIAGEAGLGKTSVVTAAARMALADGAIVLWGAGHEAEGQTPYGAVVEALDGWLAGRPPAERARVGAEYPELAELLPSLGNTGADTHVSPDEERQRLFRAVVALLADLAEAAPLLVVLDDLQAADLGSFQLLGHLARRIAAGDERVRVLATYRDDEFDVDDARRTVMATLIRDGLAREVTLPRLGREDCLALVSDVLGGAALTSQARERMWDLSLGHPLFAVELAREVDAVGAGTHPPRGVRQLVAGRLARLEPAARRAVEVVAVAGGEASMAEIVDVAARALHPPLSSAEAAAAIDEAVAAAVLTEREVIIDGRPVTGLVFHHPLVRMTSYDELSAARRQLLHAAFADVVLQRRPHAVDALATHLVRADDPRATTYLHAAARRAAALSANDTADRYYAELISRLDAASTEAARMRLDRSQVLHRAGRFDEALIVLREALPELRRRGDDDGVVLGTARLSETLVSTGSAQEALELLDAEPISGDTTALPATEHQISRTRVYLLVGRFTDAVASAGRARVLADGISGPERRGLLARTMQYQAASLALDGRLDEASVVADEALPHAEAYGDPQIIASVLSVQREQARRSGDLEDAVTIGHRALALAERSGNPVGVAFEQANLAEIHLLRDEPDRAAQLAEEAVGASRDHPDQSTPYALIALARVRMQQGGDPTELLDLAEELAVATSDRQAENEARAARTDHAEA